MAGKTGKQQRGGFDAFLGQLQKGFGQMMDKVTGGGSESGKLLRILLSIPPRNKTLSLFRQGANEHSKSRCASSRASRLRKGTRDASQAANGAKAARMAREYRTEGPVGKSASPSTVPDEPVNLCFQKTKIRPGDELYPSFRSSTDKRQPKSPKSPKAAKPQPSKSEASSSETTGLEPPPVDMDEEEQSMNSVRTSSLRLLLEDLAVSTLFFRTWEEGDSEC